MKKLNPLLTIIILGIILSPIIVNAQVIEKQENGHWCLYDEAGNKLKGFQYIEQLNKTCYYD